MASFSPRTYKIVSYQIVPDFRWDEAVDWAFEMIELGFDTENLIILAGLPKPLNHFETTSYLNAAINELGLNLKSGDEGMICYSKYYIEPIANGIGIRDNLQKLSEFVWQVDYPSVIYPFYRLHFAWDELDDMGVQWYHDSATLDNIEQITINTAKQWLGDNEDKLKLF